MTSRGNRHAYYHEGVRHTLEFLLQPGKKILFFGSYDGRTLSSLSPSKGVGVEKEEQFCNIAKKQYRKIEFICQGYEEYKRRQKFDYIVLNGALGKSRDLAGLLKSLQGACYPPTRLLIYQHNYLWQWVLLLAERLGLKRREGVENWLSVADVSVYLAGAGFEVTRVFRKTICPVFLFGIGPIANWITTLLPFFDFLKLDQYILARPLPELFTKENEPLTLTVCITVRNEKDNIERVVKSLPDICETQEILFVEGHSTDGTREEIERVMKKYPKKNIRVIGQPGKGQGDAIRVGFKDAKGEIIILYEGDGTSDPRDIPYFYEAMRKGRFEFIEGSRFVYPLLSEAMPFPNELGNIFFAKWFSFFLGQRTTDVLSGIKAILKRDFELLFERWGFLGLKDPFGDFELLYGATRMGLKFGEVPICYSQRTYGESKSNVVKHGLYLLRMAAKGYWIFRSN